MAQDSATPTDPVILAAQQAKAQADAETAAYTAKAAAITAKTAGEKAAVDALPTSGTSGAVSVQTDAGKAEATLLAAKAATDAAGRIGATLGPSVKGKVVHIYAGSERPTLDHWAGFNLRLQLLDTAVTPKAQLLDDAAVAALQSIKFAAAPAHHATRQLAPMAIALGISALTKLIGLFQTDYSVGGIALTTDDALLATAVAGALQAAPTNKPSGIVIATRSTTVGAADSLLALLKPVAASGANAQARIAFLQERAKAIRADANAKNQPMVDAASACDQAAAAWLVVSNGYDALLQSATTADAAGNLPITKIAEEQKLSTALVANELVLFVQMNASVGGYYTKKSLFTAFGGEPFYVAGGVVTSYTLIGGADGRVLAAGVVPLHGGYVGAPKVATIVNGKSGD